MEREMAARQMEADILRLCKLADEHQMPFTAIRLAEAHDALLSETPLLPLPTVTN
jgi:hypothetical protein